MELELYKMEAQEIMENSINKYEINLSKISTGRANPQILNSVKIIYYETQTSLHELANISVPEPRQLLIKPFDISISKDIAAAINNSKLGVNAVDEGDKIRIAFPELTTERRRELVKSLVSYTEQARVGVRNGRQEANKAIKHDEELSEDEERLFLNEIQKITDFHIEKIEKLTKEKEKDLMTI